MAWGSAQLRRERLRERQEISSPFTRGVTAEAERPQKGKQRGLILCGSLRDLCASAVKPSLHRRYSSRAAA